MVETSKDTASGGDRGDPRRMWGGLPGGGTRYPRKKTLLGKWEWLAKAECLQVQDPRFERRVGAELPSSGSAHGVTEGGSADGVQSALWLPRQGQAV